METNEIIKKLRVEKGLTQEELGKLVGVNKSTINKYENGTIKNFKNDTLESFSKIFGVPVSYILNLKTEEEILNYIPSLLQQYILFNNSAPYAERFTSDDRIKAYTLALEMIKDRQDYFTGKFLEDYYADYNDPFTIEEKVKNVCDEVIERVFYSLDFTNEGAINKVNHELLSLISELPLYFYYYDKKESQYNPKETADLDLYKDLEKIIEEALKKAELIRKYYSSN